MVHYCHCTWTAFVWIPERNLYCLRFGYRCHPYFYYCCYWWQPFCNREHCEAALVIDSVSSHTDSFRPRSGYHRKARERVFGKRERTTVYSKPKVKIHLSVPFACPSGSAFFWKVPYFFFPEFELFLKWDRSNPDLRYCDDRTSMSLSSRKHLDIMDGSFSHALQKFISAYKKDTPTNLRIIDVYLAYILLTGIFQFIYMIAVGTYPYNAFLAGFISTVGSFVLAGNVEHTGWSSQLTNWTFLFLTVNMRIQTNAQNKDSFKTISPER